MNLLYLAIALIAGLLLLVFGARAAFPRRAGDRPDEPLPWTPLQRRAWWALLLGVAGAVALVALFAVRGVEAYDREPATRLTVYGLLFVGVATGIAISPRSAAGTHRAWIDERDLRILERAPAFQGLAVLTVLGVWMIALTEAYQGSPGIPLVFPSLIFFSAVYVHVVSRSLGILIGYRRGIEDA